MFIGSAIVYLCVWQAEHPPPVGDMKCKNNRQRLYPDKPSVPVPAKHTVHVPREVSKSLGLGYPMFSGSWDHIPLVPPGPSSNQYLFDPLLLIPTVLADNVNIVETARFSVYSYNYQ